MDTYWEGRPTEPVSPELALVDPVLRERLLTQSRPSDAEPTIDLVVPLASGARHALDGERAPTPRSRVIAWTSIAASCVTAFAIALLAHAQHSHGSYALPATAPVPTAAVVTTATQPSQPVPPVEQLTPAEKRRLAALLRAPMRDPFSSGPVRP